MDIIDIIDSKIAELEVFRACASMNEDSALFMSIMVLKELKEEIRSKM